MAGENKCAGSPGLKCGGRLAKKCPAGTYEYKGACIRDGQVLILLALLVQKYKY